MFKMLLHDIKCRTYWWLKRAGLQAEYGCIIESRAWVKFPDNIELAKNVKIGHGALIHCGQKPLNRERKNVVIGENSYIGPNSVLLGEGGIEIGKNCEIAPGVVITAQQHTFSRKDVPIKEQPSESAMVSVEDDVWIGCNASILPGITIGKGSVVGAGAVVTKDIPPYSVAVGVPAKVIKRRG